MISDQPSIFDETPKSAGSKHDRETIMTIVPCRKKANTFTVLNLRLINHFESLAVYVSIDLRGINLSTEWKLGSSQCPEPHRPMLKYFLDHQVNRNAYPKLNCIYPLVLWMKWKGGAQLN